MCGRYALAGDWSEFTREFELTEVPGLEPRYNIAPSSAPGFEAPFLKEAGTLSMGRFWYIPSWWTRPLKELPTAFNARSETVVERPFFREARRCLIPVSGWREFPGPQGKKRAFNFESDGEEQSAGFFSFAGICSQIKQPDNQPPVESFAIITGPPHDMVRPIHDRMPLIVPRSRRHEWLDTKVPHESAVPAIVRESLAVRLKSYECSTFGNSTRVEGPMCIAKVVQQGLLF
jgi:putative SOS response-associated peptidase YedK